LSSLYKPLNFRCVNHQNSVVPHRTIGSKFLP
jgi:hypothetical protein